MGLHTLQGRGARGLLKGHEAPSVDCSSSLRVSQSLSLLWLTIVRYHSLQSFSSLINKDGSHDPEARGLYWFGIARYPRWIVRCFRWCPLWVCCNHFDVNSSCLTSISYDTGTIGGILGMPYWRNQFSTGYKNKVDGLPDVTSAQTSEIVSILSAGTFFGALTAAPVADALGRRLGLVVSCIVFCLGVILQTVATDIPLFVAGRFFAGYGVGMISATIPLYQSETSPKWIRGAIVGCYQLAITIGLLLAAIVDNATKGRMDSGSYRIPIAVQFAWALVIFVGCIFLPETPRWYIKKGQPEKAAKSLSKLRRLSVEDPALLEELAEITANHEYELSLGQATYIDCFKGILGWRLLTGCLLQSLQQLTGVNFIFYYGTKFFQNAGFTNPFVISMITSSINVASTLPGLYMVEKWGRRNLLLFGAIGMAVCQFIVAITGTVVGTQNQAAQNSMIAFVCIYIFFFACSWGPVAWVVTGELFPLKVRAKSLSMTTASNWLLNWAIG